MSGNQQHEINILNNVKEKAVGISKRLEDWADECLAIVKKELAELEGQEAAPVEGPAEVPAPVPSAPLTDTTAEEPAAGAPLVTPQNEGGAE